MDAVRRILLIGGPGSGKTALINLIESKNYLVHHEVSREITIAAQQDGVEQLFLEDPLAFSNKLLAGRISQFQKATSGLNFYDRGIPDVPAYLLINGDEIPQSYIESSAQYKYDIVFFLPPWQDIFKNDNERYETYDQAQYIGGLLNGYYSGLGYILIHVPKTTLENRFNFIKDQL